MYKKRNKSLISCLLVIMVFIVSIAFYSCGSGKEEKKDLKTPTEKLKPISFRLKWVFYSSFASHFVALEKGFFKDEGLEVTIQPGGPGIDPIKLVATGTDQVGLAGYEQILMAREKEIPLVAIGEDYIRSGVGLFSLKDSGIKEPKDFIGKKVGILPGTDKHTLYVALMKKLNIDRAKIEEIPAGASLTLLFNKVMDVYPGFITNQPFVAEEQGFHVNIIDPYDYGVRPGGNVYFTSEETLKNRRSELKAFIKATLRGIIESQKMKDEEVVDIVLKYNDKLDRNAEIKIWKSTKDILLEKDPKKVGFLYEEKWKYTAEISKEAGLIKEVPPLEKCYTNELVEESHKEGYLKK